MAITLVGGSYSRVATGSVSTNLSSMDTGTIQSGDVAVFTVMVDQDDLTGISQDAGTTLTETHYDESISGRDRASAYYAPLVLDGTETTFTFSSTGDTAEEKSILVSVWRGVDNTTPSDVVFAAGSHYTEGQNNYNLTPDPITTVTDGAMVVIMETITHDDITTAGAPSGYSIAVDGTGTAEDHAQQIHVYKEVATAGTETPGAFTHTVNNTVSEAQCRTIALRPEGDETLSPSLLSTTPTLYGPTVSRTGIAEYIDKDDEAAGGTASIELARPASANDGDWLVAGIAIRGTYTITAVPSGWSLETSIDGGGANETILLVYKMDAALETADTGPWTWTRSDSTGGHAAGVVAVRGTDGTVTASATTDHSSGTSHANTGITAADGDLLIGLWAMMPTGNNSWTADASMTERVDVNHGSGTLRASILIATEEVSSGATGTRTSTSTQTDDAVGIMLSMAVSDTSTNLTPSALTVTPTIHNPSVTAGAVTLSPSKLTVTPTFHAPTVTAVVQVSPSKLTVTPTYHNPTVTAGAVTLSPSKLTVTPTIHSPSLSVGAVTLSPSKLTVTPTIYTPSVSAGAVNVSPSKLTVAPAFYNPAIAADAEITPSKLTVTPTIHSPVVKDSRSIAPSKLTAAPTIYNPTVTVGSVTVTPSKLTVTPTLPSPTVTVGSVSVTANKLTVTPTFPSPTVTAGSVTVTPSKLTVTPTFYTPSIALSVTVTPSKLTVTPTFHGPSVSQMTTLTVPYFSVTPAFYQPTIQIPVAQVYVSIGRVEANPFGDGVELLTALGEPSEGWEIDAPENFWDTGETYMPLDVGDPAISFTTGKPEIFT